MLLKPLAKKPKSNRAYPLEQAITTLEHLVQESNNVDNEQKMMSLIIKCISLTNNNHDISLVINHIKDLHHESSKLIPIYENAAIRELNAWEDVLRNPKIFPNQEHSALLDVNALLEKLTTRRDLITLRRNCIKKVFNKQFIEIQSNAIDPDTSTFQRTILFLEHNNKAEGFTQDLMQSANFTRLDEEYSKYDKTSRFLAGLQRIENAHKKGNVADSIELRDLESDVHIVCQTLIDHLSSGQLLAILSIHSISYVIENEENEHATDKKTLILIINNALKIEFTGQRAIMLEILLGKPLEECDADELTKQQCSGKIYNVLQQEVDKINMRILTECVDSGLCPVYPFLKIENYTIWINQKYARLVTISV